jgi:flagellar hook-length control protein FliK
VTVTDPANPTAPPPAVPPAATPAAPIDAPPAAGTPPTPGPAVSSARLDPTANPSPPPVGGTAADSTPAHPRGATSNEPTAPAAVDAARRAPFDRARPQLSFSTPNSGPPTTTTTAPTQTATATAEDTTAAGATVTVPPAEQLVSVLTPLRSTPNGTYTLRLELKPPELGRVEMRVEMKDGVLSASIHADREGSAQLVRDALSDLRDLLNTGGIHTGDLTVSDGGVGPGSRDARDAPSSTRTMSPDVGAPSDDAATVGTIRSAADLNSTSLLDVRL